MNLSVYTDGSCGKFGKHGVGVFVKGNGFNLVLKKKITDLSMTCEEVECNAIIFGLATVVRMFPHATIEVYADCNGMVHLIQQKASGSNKKIRNDMVRIAINNIVNTMNKHDIMISFVNRKNPGIKRAHNLANSARKAKK